MLAMLSLIFAAAALLLAGVGLYGVLNYSMLQRPAGDRHPDGSRSPSGADVVRRVTAQFFAMLLLGAGAGLVLGVAAERCVESLLYQVKATDLTMIAAPAAAMLVAAFVASPAPAIRAIRIDPALTLRAD